jgi:ubiquinone/menaquinone biosynthesis C-methylase UbiE
LKALLTPDNFITCIIKNHITLIIDYKHLEIFCCPECHSRLALDRGADKDTDSGSRLICKGCGRIYNSYLDHPDFLGNKELQHPTRWIKYMRTVYAKVYTTVTNIMFIPCGGARNARLEVMERLEIKKDDYVLETGIGAGDNLPYLNRMFDVHTYFGLDIQKQMIRLCKKNMKKWGLAGIICRADAQALPYADESFDFVFHLGAINLFTDKKKAIEEMIRVAKPGTKIVIADETEKAGKLLNIFMGKQEEIIPPVELVPDNMEDIKLEFIWKDYGYLIEFRKPV